MNMAIFNYSFSCANVVTVLLCCKCTNAVIAHPRACPKTVGHSGVVVATTLPNIFTVSMINIFLIPYYLPPLQPPIVVPCSTLRRCDVVTLPFPVAIRSCHDDHFCSSCSRLDLVHVIGIADNDCSILCLLI